MIPGEIFPADTDLTLNAGAKQITLMIANTGDFDRDAAYGCRLDIAAGTAVRFEPGQRREVNLIPFGGARRVFGFNAAVMGDL